MRADWYTLVCATFVSFRLHKSPDGETLTHTDALNRFPLGQRCENPNFAADDNSGKAPQDVSNSLRIMMYMFPRQFGLHNAFTSEVDTTKTAQKLQDYTLREEEIFSKFQKKAEGDKLHLDVRIPKRLRGELEHLIRRLQAFHARCSYAQLLHHYCPVRLIFTLQPFKLRQGLPKDCGAPGSLRSCRLVTSLRNTALIVTVATLGSPLRPRTNFRGRWPGAERNLDELSQEKQ